MRATALGGQFLSVRRRPDLLGFKPGAANSAEALLALKLVFALGPALAHLASAWLISGFSLDAASHANIRRQLDSRDAAAVPAE